MPRGDMEQELFNELMQSLTEAAEHSKGLRDDLRVTVLPRPPKPMGKTEIIRLRKRLNYSQSLFAKYLNVSVRTVQAWEQGVRKPSDAALKLLSVAKKNPSNLL